MADTPIQIVNESDEPVGAGTIAEVRKSGAIHRIARIMVEDDRGRVLLQKRSQAMQAWPGYWDNSAAGHVDDGESYEQAAKRELKEEIGLDGCELEEIFYYRTTSTYKKLKLNRFNKLFLVIVPGNTKFEVQESEVEEVKWFTGDQLKILVEQGKATDGLSEAFEHRYR